MSIEWDDETDVVVVGTGAGGFGAALTSASRGAFVTMIEKAEEIGGTTKKSAAAFWILNNHFMREAGIEDPRDQALKYMARVAFPVEYDADADQLGLTEWEYTGLATFYDKGSEALEYYERIGAFVAGCKYDYPDYHAHLAEDAAPVGRCLYPLASEGGQIGGRILIEEMSAAAARAGIDILTSTRVVDVIQEAGSVIGAVGETPAGRTIRLRANRGVVFASGGFTHNAELRRQYLRGPFVGGCAAVTNTGDLIPIAQGLGADLANMNNAWAAPIVLERLMKDPKAVAGSFIIPGDASFAVNKYGHRFVNERLQYHETAQAQFLWEGERQEFVNLPAIVVWDNTVQEKAGGTDYGNPIPAPDINGYWVLRGETWEELVVEISNRLPELRPLIGKVELDNDFLNNLKASVARFNSHARSGVDQEFNRGTTVHEIYLSEMYDQMFGLKGSPNPTMRALSETGPYFATIMGPGTLDTKGGPKVDVHGRVLRPNGEPIAGLYAVGNCAGTPTGNAYWAAGATIGPTLTNAYMAGVSVSS